MSDHFFAPTTLRARKNHQCDWCGEIVTAGDLYTSQSGYYEGMAFRNKFHPGMLGSRSA